MSRVRADRFTNREGTGSPTFVDGVNVVGVSSLGITTVTGVGQTALTVEGDVRVTGVVTTSNFTINDSDYPTAGPLSNRNLVGNGAMNIAQRTEDIVTGVANNASEGYQSLDRYAIAFTNTAGGVCAIGQSQTVPANQGFSNSYSLTVTTANAAPTGDLEIYPYTRIEAQDVRNSGWNYTDPNSYITLSFWARSNKAGTHIVMLAAIDGTAQRIPFEYTLVADQWTHVVKHIPGNANITIDDNTGVGLDIHWKSLQGSNRNQGTDGVWSDDTTHRGTTNGVNLFDTVGNNFFLTGVQLEVGQKATPFEHRSHGDDLAKCQRYFYRINGNTADQTAVSIAYCYDATDGDEQFRTPILFPVTMRAVPGASGSGGLILHSASNEITVDSIQSLDESLYGCGLILNCSSSAVAVRDSGMFRLTNTAEANLSFSAEI